MRKVLTETKKWLKTMTHRLLRLLRLLLATVWAVQLATARR